MEFANQGQIEDLHPPEWVKHQKATETWVQDTFLDIGERLSEVLEDQDESLDKALDVIIDQLESNPPPIAPIYR